MANEDATAEGILSLTRTLKSADVEGVGTVYYYDPVSLAERAASQKHIRTDGESITIGLEGVVDGLMARLKDKDGKPMFFAQHRRRLMESPADRLQAIWNAIGGTGTGKLSEAVEDAEKN